MDESSNTFFVQKHEKIYRNSSKGKNSKNTNERFFPWMY